MGESEKIIKRELLGLCKLSYLPPDAFKRCCANGYTYSKSFHTSTGLDVYFVKKGGQTILVVRGSDEISDWLRTNIDIRWEKVDGFKVHRGFYRQALELKRIMYSEGLVADIATGHSLGAATVEALKIIGPDSVKTAITFGGPGVCSIFGRTRPTWPTIYNFTRIVGIDDVIGRVPLTYNSAMPTYLLHSAAKTGKFGHLTRLPTRKRWIWLKPLFTAIFKLKTLMSRHHTDWYLENLGD